MAVAAVVVLGLLALGGWAIWGRSPAHHHQAAQTSATRAPSSTTSTTTGSQPRPSVTPLKLRKEWTTLDSRGFTDLATDGTRIYALGLADAANQAGPMVGIDARTGQRLWTAHVPSPGAGLSASAGVVLVNSVNGTGQSLLAYDGRTGKLKWRNDQVVGGTRVPVVAKGVVLITTQQAGGDLAAQGLRLSDGSVAWTVPTSTVQHGLVTEATDGDLFYGTDDQGRTLAFDPATGKTRWSGGHGQGGYALLAPGSVVISVGTGPQPPVPCTAIDVRSGKTRWRGRLQVHGAESPAVIIGDRLVTADHRVAGYDVSDGEPAWTRADATSSAAEIPLAAVGDHLLTASDTNSHGPQLRELDPANGRTLRDTPVGPTSAVDIVALPHLVVVQTVDRLVGFSY